jgi:hypothetical protein
LQKYKFYLKKLNFLEELDQNTFSSKFKTLIDAVFELKRNQKTRNTSTKIESEEVNNIENHLNESLFIDYKQEKVFKNIYF